MSTMSHGIENGGDQAGEELTSPPYGRSAAHTFLPPQQYHLPFAPPQFVLNYAPINFVPQPPQHHHQPPFDACSGLSEQQAIYQSSAAAAANHSTVANGDNNQLRQQQQQQQQASYASSLGRGVPRQDNVLIPPTSPPQRPPPQHQHQMPQHPQQHQQHPAPAYPYHREVREIDPGLLVNEVNPNEYKEPMDGSCCFVIKSYSEEDIHRAIKYSIWCSSRDNNHKLNEAYMAVEKFKGRPPSTTSSPVSTPSSSCGGYEDSDPAFLDRPMVYLFFSVNGSGHFCGVARLASALRSDVDAGVWSQSKKWVGMFRIRWLYVKDVPNAHLRHIRLHNNENKPVTNTRDGQFVELNEGRKVLHVIHHFQYTTTLFDDYDHYDQLEEEKNRRGK